MKRFLWLLLLLPSIAQGQAVVALSPVARQQFFTVSGAPLASGCISTFQTGTSTPLATYVDATGTTPNSQPIILDSSGSANIWLTNAAYRFVVVAYDGIPGNKCAAGVTQYTIDGINAFSAISTGANLFLLGQSSDPAGTAGEMVYRNDIPCFRFFTTFWDCVVRLTDTQTLTNKTLASPILTGTVTGGATFQSPVLTNPSINGTVVTGPPATYLALSNDITTGTTANTLTKMLGATAVITATTDTGGAVGITTAGAGKAGNATIQQSGSVSCVFDGSTTAGDYVQISSTVAGNCHDAGATYPASGTGQVIGRAQLTAAGAGTYAMVLFGPEIKPVGVVIAALVNLTAQQANIANTTLVTPGANGFYRMTCYEVETQAATTSSTLPQCNLVFTDADSSIAQSVNICANSASNLVGQICGPGSNSNALSFFAKSGVAIAYSTSGYASVGGTVMQYAVHVRLEGPF